MKWLVVLAGVAGCALFDPRPKHIIDPITPDAGPFVHCGQSMVMTGERCEYQVDNICEYSEGIDAGSQWPITRCRCRSSGEWYCVEQPYPACEAGEHDGATCMAGAAMCQYELEADAGPSGTYTCTCTDGVWHCVLPY